MDSIKGTINGLNPFSSSVPYNGPFYGTAIISIEKSSNLFIFNKYITITPTD